MTVAIAALVASLSTPVLSNPDEWTVALPCPHPKVLVFSKTAAFRHDSIPDGVEAIKKLGQKHGFDVDATEDSSVFTEAGLKKYDAILFLSTTGDILNNAQQAAFEGFMAQGGGYVGVHASTDCEYDWAWYGDLVGAYFQNHPAIQEAHVAVEDRTNPGSIDLPDNWRKTDEWYNFRTNPRTKVTVLATLDEKSYTGGTMGDHPIMWCTDLPGRRTWYTNLGHRKETYQEQPFLDSLAAGIVWSAQAKKPAGSTVPDWPKSQWKVDAQGLTNGGQRVQDIVSKKLYGDQMLHVEFRIPQGSNSGVYVLGNYEVQVFDSYGKPADQLTFADCGGIYEGFEKTNRFLGSKPAKAAVKKPGEWNTYDVLFRAPRFKNGKKVENARFIEVRLNGIVVQSNVDMIGPTGAPLKEKESATGPLRLQGDHGPVEYRNIWVKPLHLS